MPWNDGSLCCREPFANMLQNGDDLFCAFSLAARIAHCNHQTSHCRQRWSTESSHSWWSAQLRADRTRNNKIEKDLNESEEHLLLDHDYPDSGIFYSWWRYGP